MWKERVIVLVCAILTAILSASTWIFLQDNNKIGLAVATVLAIIALGICLYTLRKIIVFDATPDD